MDISTKIESLLQKCIFLEEAEKESILNSLPTFSEDRLTQIAENLEKCLQEQKDFFKELTHIDPFIGEEIHKKIQNNKNNQKEAGEKEEEEKEIKAMEQTLLTL